MFYFYIAFIFLLFSCSNNADSLESSIDNADSIRRIVEDDKSSVQWVYDTENSTDSETSNWQATSTMQLDETNPIWLYVQHNTIDTPVYPSLEGFGSLNTESIPQNLYNFIKDFLLSIDSKNILEEYFDTDKAYLKTIIEYEIFNFPKIQRYLIGEAFIFDNPKNAYEIPIRIFFDNSYVDCFLYCAFVESEYKIEQFDIGAIIHE